jgi:hypothetical protein
VEVGDRDGYLDVLSVLKPMEEIPHSLFAEFDSRGACPFGLRWKGRALYVSPTFNTVF